MLEIEKASVISCPYKGWSTDGVHYYGERKFCDVSKCSGPVTVNKSMSESSVSVLTKVFPDVQDVALKTIIQVCPLQYELD